MFSTDATVPTVHTLHSVAMVGRDFLKVREYVFLYLGTGLQMYQLGKLRSDGAQHFERYWFKSEVWNYSDGISCKLCALSWLPSNQVKISQNLFASVRPLWPTKFDGQKMRKDRRCLSLSQPHFSRSLLQPLSVVVGIYCWLPSKIRAGFKLIWPIAVN